MPSLEYSRVADAAPGGHKIKLSTMDHGMIPDTVGLFDFSVEEPADGLQARVGMWWDGHAAGGMHVVRAVVFHKAPSANERPAALRQGASHGHGTGPTQRHEPRG